MARTLKKGIILGRAPCLRGHVGPRYAADRACVQCAKERAAERYVTKRAEVIEQTRARYRSDPETHKDRVARRRQREPEAVRSEKRAEYQRHKETYVARAARWRLADPARAKEVHREWRRRNPDKVLHYSVLTHTERLKRRPPWLTAEHKRAMRRFYAEAQRLTAETGIKHSVDHIVPLRGRTVSGLHVPWNLQILTVADNRAKSNTFGP